MKWNPTAVYIMFLISLMILTGCCGNLYDQNFIPYRIIAFDVWVYNNKTDKEYYVGRISTNYLQAQDKLYEAQELACYYAKVKKLKDWDYICCTVTGSSDCVTKIR